MTLEQFDAIDLLNDLTEHRFGSGPLEDSFSEGKALLRKAERVAARAGYDTTDIRKILGL